MTNPENESKTELLKLMARTWTLGRVLIEHANAGTAPVSEDDLNERQELTVRLIQLFPNRVFPKTLCNVFGITYSQVGQLVDGLTKKRLLEKKSGREKPLRLTEHGKQKAEDVEVKRGLGFTYVCENLNPEQMQQLLNLMKTMYGSSEAQINLRLFGAAPPAKSVGTLK